MIFLFILSHRYHPGGLHTIPDSQFDQLIQKAIDWILVQRLEEAHM